MTFDVELKNVSLQYKDFKALDNVSLKLDGGKIYGLLGRNGAGKTTLLSLLAAFHKQTQGEIEIGGEPSFENAGIMQHVAFLYESDLSYEYEYVSAMLEIVGRYRPKFDAEYADYLVKRFKLPTDKYVKDLSKGMQSALGVTMGLASRAPLTIFDEVYLGMDAPTREIFYQELLEDQAKHPRTFILSTHLVSEMDYLFDEVVIIDKGKVVLHEEYETLVSKGASITGSSEAVDEFVSGKTRLSEQRLSNTKSVMIYEYLDEARRQEAIQNGLEIGPISLQDLFIYLTREEA